MQQELYTDGISEITAGAGIIRVDLFSLSPTERDANNAPKKVFRQRLIFNVQGFANSVGAMQNALKGLIETGALKRVDARAASPESGPKEPIETTAKVAQGIANVSSNFS